MRQEPMDAGQALAEGSALPYALIFTYNGVSLGPAPDAVAAEEVTEARFFSETREIHLWREGGGLHAASISDTAEDADGELVWYRLEQSAMGACIAVKRYLDYDEDGQAFLSARRLAGWKGGNGHG